MCYGHFDSTKLLYSGYLSQIYDIKVPYFLLPMSFNIKFTVNHSCAIYLFFPSRTLYWADWNRAYPKIEVANMDGGSRHMFIQAGKMGLPNGLSINRRSNELCWTDAKFGSISCANLDDGKPQVIYSSAR